MTSDNFTRSAMEGATFALRYGMEVLLRNGVEPAEIRLIGGGAKSNLWRQLIADVFNCSVVSPAGDEAPAMGAAVQAMWCYYNSKDSSKIELKDLTDRYILLNESNRRDPDPSSAHFYVQLYHRYLSISEKLVDIY